MPIIYENIVMQPTGCKVYYKVPSTNQKHPKPTLRVVHVGTEDVEEARKAVMEDLHTTQEKYFEPLFVLIQGGKV